MSEEAILIPRGDMDSEAPCWIPREYNGKNIRPAIKCNCGNVCYIGLHHVHEDGRVTASFYDSKESNFTHNGVLYTHRPGCGWHVYLKLADYDQGEFVPEPA